MDARDGARCRGVCRRDDGEENTAVKKITASDIGAVIVYYEAKFR